MTIIKTVSTNSPDNTLPRAKAPSLYASLRALAAARVKPQPKLPDELLDRKAAAKLLGISPRTIDRWHTYRTGPPRISAGGRLVRYRLEAIVHWLQSHEVHGPRSKPKAPAK